MRNLLRLCLLTTVLVVPSVSWAVVTINFAGGVFSDSNGNPLPDGSLVMLLASGNDGVFSAPSASAFVTGDDVLLGAFSTNSVDLGSKGGLVASIAVALDAGLTADETIAVRWFPGLTTAAGAPGAGASYGQYSYTTADTNSTAADWAIPSDGNVVSPDFVTASIGGSLSNIVGEATFTVATGTGGSGSGGGGTGGAIPEPSTYALLGGLAALALVTYRRRLQARA